MLHLVGISDLIELVIGTGKTRKLSTHEVKLAQSIFGERLPYDKIQLNKSSIAAKLRIAFVTGRIINVGGPISDRLLIHELTHVYQYDRVGLVYIPRCLHAQSTSIGYNFGKIDDHLDIRGGRNTLNKLNYEQQAEFLAALYQGRMTLDLPRGINRAFPSLNFEI